MSAPVVQLPRALLLKAIRAADASLLKQVLTQLCLSSDAVATTVSEYLLVQKGELLSSVSTDDDEEEERTEGGKRDKVNGTKRKAEDEDEDDDHDDDYMSSDAETEDFDDDDETGELPAKRIKLSAEYTGADAELMSRYETCSTCNKRFDILVNHPEACKTHEGDIEVNYDDNTWADDDQVEAGIPIDAETDWRREEFPNGFIWTCCDGNGDAKPCRISRHVAR